MDWTEVRAVLIAAWTSVSGRYEMLAAGLLLAVGSIWLLMHWRYGVLVATLRARLKRAEGEIRAFENAFGGETHAQAAARLKRLESYVVTLPPRRLGPEQWTMIVGTSAPPPAAPYLTVLFDAASDEARRFAQDFVEAFSAAPGWNVVGEAYPKMPHAPVLGVAVGLADPDRPTPTEQRVLGALEGAGVVFERLAKTPYGGDAEIIVAAR